MKTLVAALLALKLSPEALAQSVDPPAQVERGVAQPEPVAQPTSEKDGTQEGALRRRLGLLGSVRSGLWSSSRSLDDRGPLFGTALWTQLAPRLGAHTRVFFDGWVGAADFSDADSIDGQLRELYADLRFGRLDLRAGKQIIAWGRADGVNPTDNLTPRDLTVLVSEEDDQRTGAPGVRASAHLGALSLTGVCLGRFTGHTFPLRAPPGLRLQAAEPKWDARQFAIKLERVGGAFDGSLSYVRSFDQLPDASFDWSGDTPVLRLESHRVHIMGADFAAVFGRVGLRAEAAYTRTEDTRGDNPEIKNPTLFVVVGADRTFHEYLYLNLQYLFRAVENFHLPDGPLDDAKRQTALLLGAVSHQVHERQHGATFKVSNKWRNETLEAEATGIFFAQPNQGVLRSKVTYAVTDRWRVIAGGELLRGEPSSLFNLLRNNSSLFAEVRFGY